MGDRSHSIRLVPDEQLRQVLDQLGLHGTDYGSFVWLQLNEAELATLRRLDARFSELEGATQVRLPGYRFDPIRDGEPQLPARLMAKPGGPRLQLLQLVGPLRYDWPELLGQNRIRLLQYLPHHTYLVWVDRAEAGAEVGGALADVVRWQGEYHPAYKISPVLARLLKQEGRQRVHIVVCNEGSVDQTRAAIKAAGVSIASTTTARPDQPYSGLIAALEAEELVVVAGLPTVVWIGPYDLPVHFDDEMSAMAVAGEYDEQAIRVGYRDWLAERGYDGLGVIWSVLDSGVDPDHPDLPLIGGYSHGCETPVPGDDTDPPIGHGTPVAGIVAGRGSTGMTDERGFLYGLGIAPGASLYSQNYCWPSNGTGPPSGGWPELSRVAEQAGASGTNNSWGAGDPYIYQYLEVSQSYDLLVRDADLTTPEVAEEHIMVFSVGNNGPAVATISTPAQAKNVISVGASHNARQGTFLWIEPSRADLDEIALTSSRGPTADGRIAPTVVAPGAYIISARHARGGDSGAWEIPDTDGKYGFFSGTSAAAPHVSGTLAVLTEWWRDHHGGADPSPAMARALLVNGAVDMSGTPPIPNFDEGWGRIHLGNVIDPGVPTSYLDQSHLLTATGAIWKATIEVPDPSRPLKVTLAWSDAPAALEADPVLVNDLDLQVTCHSVSYLGNQFSDGWSVSGGEADSLNNLENVYLQEPPDTATLTVTAARLAADGVPLNGVDIDQDFALVCSNCCGLDQPQPRRARRRHSSHTSYQETGSSED